MGRETCMQVMAHPVVVRSMTAQALSAQVRVHLVKEPTELQAHILVMVVVLVVVVQVVLEETQSYPT